jgi:hypothetical protein
MAKRSPRLTLDRVLLAITALFVLGGFMALGFSQRVSEENRALLVIVSTSGIMVSLASLMLLSFYARRLRRWTWQRAITGWSRNSRAGVSPKFSLPADLEDGRLRQLAIQVFSRMGYRVALRPEESPYLTLINPEGRIELVACKGQAQPVELHHVNSLDLEMRRIKAARGFFWAPAGFTGECAEWAGRRSIVLADRLEIGRLVDCAHVKGSRFLEAE